MQEMLLRYKQKQHNKNSKFFVQLYLHGHVFNIYSNAPRGVMYILSPEIPYHCTNVHIPPIWFVLYATGTKVNYAFKGKIFKYTPKRFLYHFRKKIQYHGTNMHILPS